MILLRMFFVFEGLWQKFFETLEAWIRRASPICGLLRFLEAFELDSSNLWDLGRWFGWFLFECSSYSKLKFLKFLEASKLSSNRASRLLNLDLLQLFSLSLSLASPWNVLGRLLFIGVWGWVSDTWRSLIGDTCHSLIGLLMSSLTHARIACVITYTSEDCLCHHLHVRGCLCRRLHVRWCVIGFCMTLGKFPLASE